MATEPTRFHFAGDGCYAGDGGRELTEPTRFHFAGDGCYAGDGGRELERLWHIHSWKALRNCDGRYASKGTALVHQSLQQLCDEWHVKTSAASVCLRRAADDQDGVEFVRLTGGGGILTYVKPVAEENSAPTFVHTLNTESGLCRKLLALQAGDQSAKHAIDVPAFGALCTLLSWIPEPERTKTAPALAVAFRMALARSATRPRASQSDPPAVRDVHAPMRSVEYMLAGESVKTNRHLARFAATPFLPRLLNEPAFAAILNKKSKMLRKEITEAYVCIEALEAEYDFTRGRDGKISRRDGPVPVMLPPPTAVVDLCCGKGFFSLLLALEYPWLPIVLVDSNPSIKMEHVAAIHNLAFLRADISRHEFIGELEEAVEACVLKAAVRDSRKHGDAEAASVISPPSQKRVATVGMHLCGPLSPRAIDIFAAAPIFDLLLLVPCCLDARTDLPLKLQARAEKIHPYEVKVRQLSALLEGHAGVKVTVTRDEVMSSFSTESKNALILGTKRHDATGTGPCLTCLE